MNNKSVTRQGITAITMQNFKAVRDPVKICFAPITMLFGANSAGKSTVIHAIDFFKTILNPGAAVPLDKHGGFKGMVHGHLQDQFIRLRVEMAVDDDGLPAYPFDESNDYSRVNNLIDIESLWIECAVGADNYGASDPINLGDHLLCSVKEYAVGINGIEVIRCFHETLKIRDGFGVVVVFNKAHPILKKLCKSEHEIEEFLGHDKLHAYFYYEKNLPQFSSTEEAFHVFTECTHCIPTDEELEMYSDVDVGESIIVPPELVAVS